MYKQRRNANFHLSFFVRERFWPLFIPSITILFLTFCPQISQSIRINNNENPDRTVSKLGPRDIQITTPLSIPSATSNSDSQETADHTLYVISLDGKITAIDARANGHQLWTTDTGAPLVDSSLSKIDISRDSRSVHLIPSLIGGLYEKYDEDGHVEPLPFDADSLLDSSFKLHDEVVMTGGKHIDTLGLDLHTGKILYSFSKDDPKHQNTLDNNRTTTTTADTNDQGSTLVLKRTTQTVRARNVRNGHEKWNFSVSNHHLFHVRHQAGNVVFGQVDADPEDQRPFSGYFEYQLQTGVVIAFDQSGRPVWSSAVNAPIAAVWELKNGQLNEKSLFETATTPPNYYSEDDSDEDDAISPPPLSRRLAFIGEFNSTPYVIVSPSVQKQLMYDARKNNVGGSIGAQRTSLSSWHKAYQKRTLSIGAELPENNNAQTSSTPSSGSHYPLALRPDPTINPHSHLSSTDETCDTAGYLELIANANQHYLADSSTNHLNTHTLVYIPTNVVVIFTLFIGAVFILAVWYLRQKQIAYLSQRSITSQISVCTVTPPATPDYHQIEQPATPLFQSRYNIEYEHMRFLGRGGFGVVFEAINKLDERRVAIKRVSLKKASGKERALKEIRYLAVLNHPNLIQYYYAWNESPPTGWQEEEDRLLLVRDSANKRDSMSTFPTTGNDSASINQCRSGSTGISSVSAVKPSATSHPLSFEITFDRSSHPLLINENFSANSSNANDPSDSISSSSSSFDQQIDANNNTKSTTKSSLSSSSPLFDHSSDSSNEKPPEQKERTESDDGIVFLPDEKQSVSVSPIPTQTKVIPNEKEIPPTYFYFVMELCQPESLRDRLIQRKIDRQQAWSIFDQIIQGIEYIHSQKLIHRDLKPSNILFSMDNTVKIGDFGLVSAFGDEKLSKKIKRDDDKFDLIESTSLTSDGGGNQEHGGTMLYMSPEQMNREPYNQKVDIYAIGIILFELLYPFSTQMERMQSIANVRQETPVFPKDFALDGNNRSQTICRLISWLLSFSPRDRPRASDLHQSTFYQRLLQCEVPNLFSTIFRQQSQTVVNGQDQVPVCTPRARVPSSSPFRRTVSSSAIHSHKESESGDGECVL